VQFKRCIAETYLLDKLILLDIIQGNHMLEGKDATSVSNNHVRLAMYYWFGTNVYLFCWLGNRCKLPKCLINRIRLKWPKKVDEQCSTDQNNDPWYKKGKIKSKEFAPWRIIEKKGVEIKYLKTQKDLNRQIFHLAR